MEKQDPRRISFAFVVALLAGGAVAQVTWTQAAALNGRVGCGLAYDGTRDRLLLFGGQPVSGQTAADTWESDGAGWFRRTPPTSPQARSHHALAFDFVRGRIVMFGGRSFVGGSTILGDTWEWDGVGWAQRFPATNPPSRDLTAMAWDFVQARILMFGGHARQGTGTFHYYSNDLWQWDGTDWTLLSTGGPTERQSHGLAHDPARQRLVLYGGELLGGGTTWGNDTWEWDGVGWVQRTPAQSPGRLRDHTMVFDLAQNRTLLFGGSSFALGAQNATWAWDGTNWTPVATTTPPPGRAYHGMVWDTQRQRTVVFGGWTTPGAMLADTWALDAAGTWTSIAPPASPPPRNDGALAHDAARDRLVLFGGSPILFSFLNDTWESNGALWVQRTPLASPSPRAGHALATDPVTGHALLFGGGWGTNQALGDMWEWLGTTWAPVAIANGPWPRYLHRLCTNADDGTILLFGGQDPSFFQGLGDTWRFHAASRTWTQLFPAHSPSPRGRHGLARDTARDRIVLFGGYPSGNPIDDTWEWDGNDWLQRAPTVRPAARSFPGMVFDPERARIVLHGGLGVPGVGNLADTWEWDGSAWTQRAPTQSPAVGMAPMTAWDPARERTIAVKGTATWEYGPVHPAAWLPFGSGCAGTAGVPVLASAPFSRPWLGDTFVLEVGNVPPGQGALLTIGTRDLWATTPMPYALDVHGMPGCELLAGGYAILLMPGTPPTIGIGIPNTPALVGATLDAQAFVTDPPANAAGLVASAGGTLRLGAR